MKIVLTALAALFVLVSTIVTPAAAQSVQAPQAPQASLSLVQPEPAAGPPLVLTLRDALDRAKQNDVQLQTAVSDADTAREDRVQAKAALLPAVSATTQYIGNSPNGVNPNGRFVSMDGVKMYRAWGVLHQDVSVNTFTQASLRKAQAAEAAAQARLEVAQRGLAVTVTRNFYTLVAAQRRYATAQEAGQQSSRFLDIARQQERLGQVARADVVRAELADRQTQQGYREAFLAMDTARLALSVLLFPAFNENFTVVDDLRSAPVLPPFNEARSMAERANPDLRAADEAMKAATHDVQVAKAAFYPSLIIDGGYGIEANEFALHSKIAKEPELGVLPNLGYILTLNLNVPIWDWGNLRSKLHQSESRARLAQVTLSHAQRQAVANLYSMYNEALAARDASENLQQVAQLAAESLRLTNLRYQAGESTALEVVDAQNTLVAARNAADDADVRYRVALAELQTLTGAFP